MHFLGLKKTPPTFFLRNGNILFFWPNDENWKYISATIYLANLMLENKNRGIYSSAYHIFDRLTYNFVIIFNGPLRDPWAITHSNIT